MNDPENSIRTPPLNSLEFLGALSARFAHALSNQLSIVTGNLCLATALRDDPEKIASALKAAVKSADEAGLLVSRLVELRRGFTMETGHTPANAFVQLLSDWIDARPGWRLASDSKQGLASGDTIGVSSKWLAFILDAIADATAAASGTIRIWRPKTRPSTFTDSYAGIRARTGFIHLSLVTRGTREIEWESVHRELSNFPLAVAYELLSHLGATPESTRLPTGEQETKFALSLT
jgi:hypothetical protein